MTTFRHRACVKHRQARRARVIFLRLCFFVCTRASLCSKRFRLVSDQRKTEERDFSVLAPRGMKQEPKNESGGRGRAHPYTRADKFLHGQILFLDRLFRDGPLEKSACTNFCFRSLLVQDFFSGETLFTIFFTD